MFTAKMQVYLKEVLYIMDFNIELTEFKEVKDNEYGIYKYYTRKYKE